VLITHVKPSSGALWTAGWLYAHGQALEVEIVPVS
jgi:hypothetical protein